MDAVRVLIDPGVEAKSLTHALPYWAILNGAMLLADGCYELGFELQPLHLDTLSEEELESVARRLKRLIETLPARERARFVYTKDAGVEHLIRQHEALTANATGPAAYLARQRIAALRESVRTGQIIGRRLLLSLTYHPPRTRPARRWLLASLLGGVVVLLVGLLAGWLRGVFAGAALAWFVHWLSGGRPPKPFTPLSRKDVETDAVALETLRAIILSALDAAGVPARALSDQEYIDWAWRYFNPGRAAAGASPPSAHHETRTELPSGLTRPRRGWLGGGEWMADTSLRQVIGRNGIIRDPSSLLVDDQVVKVLAMDGLPVGESRMNNLVKLFASRTRFTVVVDVAREPRAAALARLALRSRLLRSIAETPGAPDTVAAERGLQTTREVQYHAVGGELEIVRFGVAVIITARSSEEVAAVEREVLEFFSGEMQDAQLVREDAALARQFFALAPFSGRINGRTRAALSITAVHFLPIAGPPPGSPRPVLLVSNRYHGLTPVDPFDLRQSAWNAVAAGATGSGKTFFASVLAMATHAAGTQVIVVDRGSNIPPGPWLSATRFLGGQYIPLDPAAGVVINPCDLAPGQVEPDAHKITFLVTLVSRMVSDEGDPLDGYERGIVEAAVRAAYARHVREIGNGDGQERVLEPIYLRDIVQSLRMLGAVAGTHQITDEDRHIAHRIAARLYQWTERGRFAALVDRATTANLNSDWVYIDVAALESNPELMPVMILVLTDLMWRHVNRQIGVRRTLVVLDEVWALIADPIAGAFVEDLYRRFRTTGSGVLSVSQDIRDFQDNKHALAVLANCNAYYLFHTESPTVCGETLRLNRREMDSNLARVSAATGEFAEVLLVQRFQDRSRSGLLALFPSRYDYWLASSHAHDRALREQYTRAHGTLDRALEALVRDYPGSAGDSISGAAKEAVLA